MSDDRTFAQVTNDRIKAEVTAFEADERAKAQMQIDWWCERQLRDAEYWRELQRRLDPFGYGHWR